MSAIGRLAGIKGAFRQVGAGTITAPNGAKITAIGIETTANVTNYIYTPVAGHVALAAVTRTTGNGWLGLSLEPLAATAYIPLDHKADSMEVASGNVWAYFD